MLILVLGKSKAGKSRWAEQAAVALGEGPLVYVATMIPVGEGEAGTATVQRHRAQRAGLDFETIEQPYGFNNLSIPAGTTVLLEDVSNLLANYLFCEGANGGVDEARQDVLHLRDRAEHLLAVSFHGLEPSGDYDDDTNHYIRELARLNGLLWQDADAVVMLESGVMRLEKGCLPAAVDT